MTYDGTKRRSFTTALVGDHLIALPDSVFRSWLLPTLNISVYMLGAMPTNGLNSTLPLMESVASTEMESSYRRPATLFG